MAVDTLPPGAPSNSPDKSPDEGHSGSSSPSWLNNINNGGPLADEDLKQQEEKGVSPGGDWYNQLHNGGPLADEDSKEQGRKAATSPGQLAQQEGNPTTAGKAAASSPGATGDSLYKADNKPKTGRLSQIRSTIRNIGSRKLLVFSGLGGLLGIFGVLFALFVLASLLKIPNLSQDIIEYEFTRLVRQSADTSDRIGEEALAVEAASDTPAAGEPEGLRGLIADKYKGLRDNTWGKFDAYRPDLVEQNLKVSNGLSFTTHHSVFGNTILDSVALDGTDYPVTQVGGITRFVPVLRDFAQFKNNVAFARDFAPALEDALEANNVSPIIRFFVDNNIRKELGIGLLDWQLAKYQGKNPQQAEDGVNQDAFDDIADQTPDSTGGVSPNVDQASQDMAQATDQAAQTAQGLEEAEQNGGLIKAAVQAADNDLDQTLLEQVIGVANPIYAIAVPLCMIFVGSLSSSAPTINSQTQAQEKSFYYVADAADQEQSGGPTDTSGYAEMSAVGGMNTKLGDISHSNAYLRAEGVPVNTAVTANSAEASPLGMTTSLVNVIPGMPPAFANAINTDGASVCKAVTNIYVAGATGVLLTLGQIVAGVLTDGGETAASGAAEGAGEAEADAVTDAVTQSLAQKFAASFIKTLGLNDVRTFGDVMAKAKGFIGDFAKNGTKIAAGILLAKVIVLAYSNTQYNGLEQGADFANEADAGGNIAANEIDRQEQFGRPLTCAEIQQSDQEDQTFLSEQSSSQSFTERYFAITNTNSLISRASQAVYTDVNGSAATPLANFMDSILYGPLSFGTLIGSLTGVARAATPCDQEDYGNVQFGFSLAEETLINSSNTSVRDSYLMLQNQQILDQSGKEDQIANQYSYCFGYDYNPNGDGSLDPMDTNGDLVSDTTGNGQYVQSGKNPSIGSLLANGDIVRDANGDVIADQGNCSPQQLSYSNPTYGDLVFRWRVAESYNLSLAKDTNLQTTSASAVSY